jgi:hypothetical protein
MKNDLGAVTKKRLFCDVAIGQRIGMKMELRCLRAFAPSAKLATSSATDWESAGPSGVKGPVFE